MYFLASLNIATIIGSIIIYKAFDVPLKFTIFWILSALTGLYFCHQTIVLLTFNKF